MGPRRQLAARNDQAAAAADVRLESWHDRMLVRLARAYQPIKDAAGVHVRWEQWWVARNTAINAAGAAREGRAMAAAYAAGGTQEVAGLAAQVLALIGERAAVHGLVASAGSAAIA